jgi:hypothetical protein
MRFSVAVTIKVASLIRFESHFFRIIRSFFMFINIEFL